MNEEEKEEGEEEDYGITTCSADRPIYSGP